MIAPLRSDVRLSDLLRSLVRSAGSIARLEAELALYFGVGKALLTHSARSGIYFLLKALPQKKVYLPAYNCWAVTEAALYAGKELEYVDISLDDYNIDLAKLRAVLEPGSIILATHQFGIPCDIDAVTELARERNCVVIEDNAAAFGAEVRGKRTGSFGSAGVLSFDYSKTVVSGKGGAILFNDLDLHAKVRALQEQETRKPSFLKSLKFALLPFAYSYATHSLSYPLAYALFPRVRGGSRSEARCDLGGGNESYHLGYDDLRAKLAWCSLQRVSETIALRQRVTDFYQREISGDGIALPVVRDGDKAAMVKYPIRIRERQAMYDSCLAQGVDLGFLFQFHYGGTAPCPNAEAAAREGIGLPVYGALQERDLYRVKEAVMAGAGRAGAAGAGRGDGAETRKLFCFTANYYWMDRGAFLNSRNAVSLLRTCDRLAESEYSFRLVYKTFLVDLGKSKDEIYAGFDYTRAVCPIKKAVKKGVVVRRAETAEEKLRYHDFYRAFAQDPKRKNKILMVKKEELDRLEILYATSADGQFLGGIGLLPSADGRYLLAKYSATLHKYSEQDLLVWQAIQYAKDAGFAFFDLSWMIPSDDPNSDQYRLFQYKKKFGGDLVDFYSYIRLKGPFKLLEAPFRLVLKHFFDDNIDNVALVLKKMGAFK